jgi:hypothetical protein
MNIEDRHPIIHYSIFPDRYSILKKAPIEIGAAHEIKVPLLAMRCKSAAGILTEYEGIAIKMLPKRLFGRKSLQKIGKRQYYLIVN